MSDPSTPLPSLVPDPGLPIRRWVAQLLRVGVGFSILNIGLAGYMAMQGTMGFPGGGGPMAPLAPFLTSLPYLAIAIGLALILGFLTTVSSIAVMLFGLVVPVFFAVSIFAGGGGPMGFGMSREIPLEALMVAALYLPSLIPQAALVWLSPLENHPISVDALIFGRNDAMYLPPSRSTGPEFSDPAGSFVGGMPAVGEPAPEVRGPGDVPLVDLQG